jgi:hypothetical protein
MIFPALDVADDGGSADEGGEVLRGILGRIQE